MIKYNSDNLLVGYIKEMLKDFNLPKFKPVNKPNFKLDDELLNVTKNFKINSLIYDSYTHIYLGDYLRCLRDYWNIDLMSMYNCFTYDMPKELSLENFKSTDIQHKIFMLPIKSGKQYTIALESALPIELEVVAYDEEHLAREYENSYKYISNAQFKKPFIYQVPNIDDINKPILKLLIKLPYACNTSIVVLEGDYTTSVNNTFIQINNSTIYSKPLIIGDDLTSDNIKSHMNLQLLYLNDGTSYPFADRLIEYLVDNAITNIDDIPNNIIRTQKALLKNKVISDYSTLNYGKWNDNMTKYILKYLMNKKASVPYLNNLFDNLGYVDKDIESGNVLGIKDETWGE